MLSLFQNLFGLAVGPFVAGALSDALGLQVALAITPLFSLLAAGAMLMASRSYAADKDKVAAVRVEAAVGGPCHAHARRGALSLRANEHLYRSPR